MRRIVRTGIAALLVGGVALLNAQKTTLVHPGKAGSAHVKTEWSIDGARISIEYGRPVLKGRADAAVMPSGQVRGREQTKRRSSRATSR